MKKAFNLVELIIVIVMAGILSVITFNVLEKVYQNYIYTRVSNSVSTKLDYIMEAISARLKDRVKNSVIVTKYPVLATQTNPNLVDFKSIQDFQSGDTGYNVLEWINKDYEAKNGMWDSSQKHIQTGWSGFVDLGYHLHQTNVGSYPKKFEINSPDSNFAIVKEIDRNIVTSLGDDMDPFDNNITTLIFAGNDLGGDIAHDLNQSYGWYMDASKDREAKAVFAILGYNTKRDTSGLYTDINITSITENNNTTLYSRYFLTRSAYALVPIKNCLDSSCSKYDYNLSLYYNYQPWRGDWWRDGNHTLLATHVTEIRFKQDKDTPIIRFYMCVQSPEVEINSTRNFTLCKEKAIF